MSSESPGPLPVATDRRSALGLGLRGRGLLGRRVSVFQFHGPALDRRLRRIARNGGALEIMGGLGGNGQGRLGTAAGFPGGGLIAGFVPGVRAGAGALWLVLRIGLRIGLRVGRARALPGGGVRGLGRVRLGRRCACLLYTSPSPRD